MLISDGGDGISGGGGGGGGGGGKLVCMASRIPCISGAGGGGSLGVVVPLGALLK